MRRLIAMAALACCSCAYLERSRAPRGREELQLESFVVEAPTGAGWSVTRSFDVGERSFTLVHVDENGKWDRAALVKEVDGARPILSHADLLAWASDWARARLGDAAASIREGAPQPVDRFGARTVSVALRAEKRAPEPGARALLVGAIEFIPPAAPDRTCFIRYEEWETSDAIPVGTIPVRAHFDGAWRALVDGVQLRPAGETERKQAARADDFPKQFQLGLARRSLTLPTAALQWTFWRERWIAPGGFHGGWGLSLGLTDRLELAGPFFVRYSFGEVEALTRPEIAVGAGWTGFQHDAERGSMWGFRASIESRKRLGADVALKAALFGEQVHESRTDRDHTGFGAWTAVVWDVHPLATVGLGGGYSSRSPWTEFTGTRLAWVGGVGRSPLVALHLPFVDLGLEGAFASDGVRRGILAGLGLTLTL